MTTTNSLAAALALLALTACDSVKTIATASPENRLFAANQLYTSTVNRLIDYSAECEKKPTMVCIEVVEKAKKADQLAYGALSEANQAYADGDSTDLAFLIGAAQGAIKGLGIILTE